MTTVKMSDLPTAGPIDGTELIPALQDGAPVNLTPAQLGIGPYVDAQPLTGATLTAAVNQGGFGLEPAGEIATLTVVMPPNAKERQVFEISTTQTIDALTVTPAAGQTVLGGGPLLLAANGGAAWRYRASNTSWYRRY
jgi:hypothetical protein